MTLSNHAHTRLQQRGIPRAAVDLVVHYGSPVRLPSGVFEYTLSSKRNDRIARREANDIQLLGKARRVAVLIGEEGTVITAYHHT